MFVFKACLIRRLQRRKRRLKEVRSQNKFAHRIIVGYVGAGYTSIVLGNHPVPVNLQRIFLLRLREGVTKQKLKKILILRFRKQKISQVVFVRLAVLRLEAHELDFFIKASFQESEHYDDSFQFKKKIECPHHLLVLRQGNAMAEMSASLNCFNLIIDNTS